MNIEMSIESGGELGEHEKKAIAAISVLDGVLRLLDEASREEEGERYMALVNAAHDFGSAMFHPLRGCCEGPGVKPETMELLMPLMNRQEVLQ